MINSLLGIKKDMTSTYDSRGRRVGATVLQISPNFITQVNTESVQLGFGTRKRVKKPQVGHLEKAGLKQPIKWFREVKASETELKPGTEITLNQVFSIGDAVSVQGISKGKGFQGGVRRHGFHGGPKTHGQSDRLRAPGSIGSGTTPGRVYKGKKMAGHMGSEQVTVKNLEVVGLKKEENLLVVKGGIPGSVGSFIMVTKLGRIKGYTPPPEEKPSEEEDVQKDSENSESQQVGESERSESRSSEAPVSSGNSDQSGTQSSSESSEKTEEVTENAG